MRETETEAETETERDSSEICEADLDAIAWLAFSPELWHHRVWRRGFPLSDVQVFDQVAIGLQQCLRDTESSSGDSRLTKIHWRLPAQGGFIVVVVVVPAV